MQGFVLIPLRLPHPLIQISFLIGVFAAVLAFICFKYIGCYRIALAQQETVK